MIRDGCLCNAILPERISEVAVLCNVKLHVPRYMVLDDMVCLLYNFLLLNFVCGHVIRPVMLVDGNFTW